MSALKDFYRKHHGNDIPLFHQPWWLDAAAGGFWDVALVREGDELKACFLYAFNKNKLGYQVVMPPLTQFLGPNYRLKSTITRERNNEETALLEQLLVQLPEAAFFESRWHFTYQNWLPFYWRGFQQTTRYSYVLNDLSDPDVLRRSFSEKIQREMVKAEKSLHITTADQADSFYALLEKNFHNKKVKMPFEKSSLQDVFSACALHQAGRIYLANDSAGNPAAGIFIVWDATTAYYIIGGKDDRFGNSGAMSLLFWNAFLDLKDTVKSFDFEGSMIKGVENYFRSFGAERMGFFQVTRTSGTLYKMKESVKRLVR